MILDQSRSGDDLVTGIQDHGQDQTNVRANDITSIDITHKRAVALPKDDNQTNDNDENVANWEQGCNVREIGERSALREVALTESDVGHGDNDPSDQTGQRGQTSQPVEHNPGAKQGGQEGQAPYQARGEDSVDRDTPSVHTGEDLGSKSALGETHQRTAGRVHARVTGRDHGDKDNSVHNIGSRFGTRLLENGGERTDRDVGSAIEKGGVGVRDDEANDQHGKDVKQNNTPKDLLDSRGHGLVGVFGFTSGNTDDFHTIEGEGCCDKDIEDTKESVGESSAFEMEVSSTNVVATQSTGVHAETNDDEGKNGDDLYKTDPVSFLRGGGEKQV